MPTQETRRALGVRQAKDEQSAAQSGKEIVAAPGAGKRILVLCVQGGGVAAGDLQLKSATTALGAKLFWPTGSETRRDDVRYYCAENAALNYDSNCAGTHAVEVEYAVVRMAGTGYSAIN